MSTPIYFAAISHARAVNVAAQGGNLPQGRLSVRWCVRPSVRRIHLSFPSVVLISHFPFLLRLLVVLVFRRVSLPFAFS